METPIQQHSIEIEANLEAWRRKPLLRKLYREMHAQIAAHVRTDLGPLNVELGSGIGNIREVLPNCRRTDIFPNPWIDQVEDAYRLSFEDETVSNLVLFDVFHHLQYPGTALTELRRVLQPNGRLILYEPFISLLGRVVYGPCHHEPTGLGTPIDWEAPDDWNPDAQAYYAAQGNATRVFWRSEIPIEGKGFKLVEKRVYSGLRYVGTGGYSKPQLYPNWAYGMLGKIEHYLEFFPNVFGTRFLVVLEKTG